MDDVKWKGGVIDASIHTFKKTIKGIGDFELSVPNNIQLASIYEGTSKALGGLGKEQVGENEWEFVRMIVTLNQCLTKTPADWPGATNCPDRPLLEELWGWFLSCEKEFADRVKKFTGGKELGAS